MNVEEKLYKLTEIGIALSSERNLRVLLAKILTEARAFTNAEGGSLYIRKRDKLVFSVSQNDVLYSQQDTIRCQVFRGKMLEIDSNSIAGYAALTKETINIADAYHIPKDAPYNIDRSFDIQNKYRTKSMLVIPMGETNEELIGVLALINARDNDEIIPFSKEYESLISSLASQAAVAIHNAQLNQQLQDAYLDTILRLSRAAEFRDKDTAFHLEKISTYSTIIARQLGFSQKYIDDIRYASPMHDIGKIGISDSILLKPGKLTSDEFEQMKQHTIYGADILKNAKSDVLELSLKIALTHHEKYDGSGYPTGLKGDEIPWGGRIVAIADVFDALTSKRCYKEAWETQKAIDYITELSGKQFDPKVVEAFHISLEKILEAKDTYESN
ncbi:HD-GYP domain-containing protein [Candidatus Uabimicrobium sp. HlEnr_7]|uniref:HD-GYP domain-containing protein n=1 Tax=Candidatus Uabimicrobium helgolandensis TaxID=3095367 RepID=UPI003558E334